ncbi:MAG: exosortase A, partial [Sphingomonadaceae bacterium]|nr:exosortase A [Sphingomonadaceae bacterium]
MSAEAVSLPRLAALTTWQRHLGTLATFAALILLLFARDAIDMARIWWDTSTFSHCLLIVPIIGWLVWQRRELLACLTPATSRFGLVIIASGAFAWLLGEAGGVATFRHLGLVVMLQGAVVATLGTAVARGMIFPLAYALFLVPVGEEIVPALQTFTAELCMVMLGWAGVPAHIEGVFITTPHGYFEVAEACAGVKFLIAMIAYGALVCALCFQSWWRKAAFMAAAVVVPILANGIRAWGTIYVAETIDPGFAASFDHIVYGWFFFAIVIALLMAIGWPFFDRAPDAPAFDPARLQPLPPHPVAPRRLALTAIIALTLALAPFVWLQSIAATARGPAMEQIAAPEISGWRPSAARMSHPWRAVWPDADSAVQARYRDGNGRTVDLAIAYYSAQDGGRELVGYGRGGLDPASDWSWVRDIDAPAGARAYRITAPGPAHRDVAQFSLIGGDLVEGGAAANLATLRQRLLGGDQRAIGV